MPSFPQPANWTRRLPANVFAPLIERAHAAGGKLVPLHIGDSYLSPPAEALAEAQQAAGETSRFRYGIVGGHHDLRRRLVRRVTERNGLPGVTEPRLLITVGATQALYCAARVIAQPGDEVLVLSPHYPLIPQAITATGATAVQVPFHDRLGTSSATELLRPHLSARTVGIVVTTPNNPDGSVLGRDTLQQIAALAADHDLWIVSDESYELIRYPGCKPHVSIGSLPEATDRTFSIFSFSKAFGLAGARIGYTVTPPALAEAMNTTVMLSAVHASNVAQAAAWGALEAEADYIPRLCDRFARARDIVAANLSVPHRVPDAAPYVFLDVSRYLDGLPPARFIERLVDETGVLVTPGAAFGDAYASWIRLCFTSVDSDTLYAAVSALDAFLAGPALTSAVG